jgi:DNA recombination protein RmuC
VLAVIVTFSSKLNDMEITSLLIVLLIGIVIAYVIFYLFNKTKSIPKSEFENLITKHNENVTALKLSEEKINTAYGLNQTLTEKMNSKESEISLFQTKTATLETHLKNSEDKISELSEKLNNELQINKEQQLEINNHKQKISELTANYNSVSENLAKQSETNEKQTHQINDLNSKLIELTSGISKLTANNTSLSEKLSTQKIEIDEIQKTAHLQFEKIANQIFEEKSKKFTDTNKINIENLLNPLKEDIGKFKTKVEETYDKESKQRFSLEEKVKDLIEQTNKVSREANNLATALKGQTKKQGNWGEMILERILETSGLTKDREYFVQQNIKDDEGKNLRPDILVNLPDERVIIIDSKSFS